MVRPWSRDALIALAAGRRISARTPAGGELDPPAWLLEHSAGAWPHNSSDTLSLLHPEDRGVLVEAFLACVAAPGEPQTVTYRSSADGYWHYSETTWVDLADHEGVGCILSFSRVIGGPPVPAPDDAERRDHARTHWMVWTVSATGDIRSAEGACRDLLGYEPRELIGNRATWFLTDDTFADTIDLWVRLHDEHGSTATARRQFRRKDGSLVWVDTSYLHRPDHDTDESVLMVIWDATRLMEEERALAEQTDELRRSEQRAAALAADARALADDFQMLADEVPAAVFRCDPSGVVLFHNARWSELVDSDHTVTRLHDIVAPADRGAIDAMLGDLLVADTAQRRSLEAADRDGTRVWRVNLRCMGDGENRNLIGSIEDVTVTVRFRREARHDTLTGLLNRAALDELIAGALTNDADTVVLFMDLDGFKSVNDRYGHEAGDEVLAEVARRLRDGVRPADAVGRYGGDEFVVVCTGSDTEAAALAGRLVAALGDSIAFAGGTWYPAASVGWARGRTGDDVAAVVRRADQQMFEAKRERRAAQP